MFLDFEKGHSDQLSNPSYNSTIFASGVALAYSSYGAYSNFGYNATWVMPDNGDPCTSQDDACSSTNRSQDMVNLKDAQEKIATNELVQLNIHECFDPNLRTVDSSSQIYDIYILITQSRNKTSSVFAFPGTFIHCEPTWTNETWFVQPYWISTCGPDRGMKSQLGYQIAECLGRPRRGECRVLLVRANMIIVIVCNILKLACIGYCMAAVHHKPVVTIGDAIANFLSRQDSIVQRRQGNSVLDLRAANNNGNIDERIAKRKRSRSSTSWIGASGTLTWLIPLLMSV